jgi:hypothetical protein
MRAKSDARLQIYGLFDSPLTDASDFGILAAAVPAYRGSNALRAME